MWTHPITQSFYRENRFNSMLSRNKVLRLHLIRMVYQTDGRFWPNKRWELNINGPGWPTVWQTPALAAMNSWNGSGASFTFASVAGAPDHLAAYDSTSPVRAPLENSR